MSRPRTASRSRRRAATEDTILDAFERVLARDGMRRLTVNAVVEEAGVGKPLLYRYFGGLNGLVAAWGERRRFWPPAGGGAEARTPEEFRDSIRRELLDTANYLKSHPVTLEFLAEELSAPGDTSTAFDQVRRDRGRALMKTMLTDQRYASRENRRVIIVLYAAITYLALRSRASPSFMGLRLDTDEGWADALAMIGELVEMCAARDPDADPPGGRE